MTSAPPLTPELTEIHKAIARACKLSRRAAKDVTLIAVSKTRSAEEILPLLNAGHRVFGENRVEEAREKWPQLRAGHDGVELHLIGQLQSKKVQDAVAIFDVIHSLDRLSLVAALGKAMAKSGRQVPCFIQVNVGKEAQKGGCLPDELGALIDAARSVGIPLLGLMCIPPAEIEAAPFFAFLGKLADQHGLPALSMGMSGDYETAIMLGASHIRVGTALFGARA